MNMQSGEAGAERRREKRRPADGTVYCTWESPGRRPFAGRLVDVSPGGFRMAHHEPELASGDRVVFRHAFAAGVAVAVWNRLGDGRRETGFLIEQRL